MQNTVNGLNELSLNPVSSVSIIFVIYSTYQQRKYERKQTLGSVVSELSIYINFVLLTLANLSLNLLSKSHLSRLVLMVIYRWPAPISL